MIRIRKILIGGTVAALTTGAIAHAQVQNETVKARMDLMSSIGGQVRTLVMMQRNPDTFDAAQAQAAFAAIQERAALIPGAFEAEEMDPESEAMPTIWTNWDDFVSKAGDLESAAAAAVAADVDSVEALQSAFGGINTACRACHMEYQS